MKCIRFLNLTVVELGDVLKKYPTLMTSDEGLNIMLFLYNPTKKRDFTSLPSWCSKNMNSRCKTDAETSQGEFCTSYVLHYYQDFAIVMLKTITSPFIFKKPININVKQKRTRSEFQLRRICIKNFGVALTQLSLTLYYCRRIFYYQHHIRI